MVWILEHWRELISSIFKAFGAIFLTLEAFEVLTNADLQWDLEWFILLGLLPGILWFLADGYLIGGFLRREVSISDPFNDAKITIQIGDLFDRKGWKAIGVNDFFDSLVDEDLVASNSLHGKVINTCWSENPADWERQIQKSLRSHTGVKANRAKGNRIRYPIGTTARACTEDQKFLFVAFGETDISNNLCSADAEMLIKAVRGLLTEARAACSMEPLAIPLMGSRFARVGIKNPVLLDLIITGVLEESRNGRITGEINILLTESIAKDINLKSYAKKWAA